MQALIAVTQICTDVTYLSYLGRPSTHCLDVSGSSMPRLAGSAAVSEVVSVLEVVASLWTSGNWSSASVHMLLLNYTV